MRAVVSGAESGQLFLVVSLNIKYDPGIVRYLRGNDSGGNSWRQIVVVQDAHHAPLPATVVHQTPQRAGHCRIGNSFGVGQRFDLWATPPGFVIVVLEQQPHCRSLRWPQPVGQAQLHPHLHSVVAHLLTPSFLDIRDLRFQKGEFT